MFTKNTFNYRLMLHSRASDAGMRRLTAGDKQDSFLVWGTSGMVPPSLTTV